MPTNTETILLGLPNRWADATFTASAEEAGGPAEDLAVPIHSSGWLVGLVWRPVNAQDETSYDNTPSTEGTFVGGSGYTVADVITLSDGSTATVDAVAAGVVTQFTVDSSASTGAASGSTLTQSSVSPPGGTGFTLTLDDDNVTGGSQSVVVDALEAKYLNAIWIEGARTTGFNPEDLRIKIETASDAAITTDVTDWTGGTVAYRMAGTGGGAPRLDMTQPGTGPTDARLAEIMADGRFRYLSRQSTALLRRYARLTFSHVATPAAGQELFIPWIWGGLAWQPDYNPDHGKISPSLVERPDGSFLFKLAFTLQVVREDELWYRAVQEFLLSSGVENRCWVWWQPDFPQRFYQQAFSGKLFPGAIDIASEFSEAAYNTQWPLEIVERFNLEVEK